MRYVYVSISRFVKSAWIDSPVARIVTGELARSFSIIQVLCAAQDAPTAPVWQALYDVAAS
jgi:hypothetical protein